MDKFKYAPMFQMGKDETEYYLLTKDYVSVGSFEGIPILKVERGPGTYGQCRSAGRELSATPLA